MELPHEIFCIIFHHLENLQYYSLVNKCFYINIKILFDRYTKVFCNIHKHWKYNLDYLVSKLFESNFTDAILFLSNNYTDCHLNKILIKYSSLYGNMFILEFVLNKVKKFFFTNCYIEKIKVTHNLTLIEKYMHYEYISFKYLIIGGHFHIIKRLIDGNKIPLELIENNFHYALLYNHLELYDFLYKKVKITDFEYFKICKIYAQKGDLENLKKYIDFVHKDDLDSIEKYIGYSCNKQMITWYKLKYGRTGYILNGIAKSGNIKLFNEFFNSAIVGKFTINTIMKYAIKGENLKMVKNIISKGADADISLEFAIIYRKYDLIEYFLKNYNFEDYNKIAISAAEIGDINLVKYSILKGANNFQEIVNWAAFCGNFHLVKYMHKNYDINLSMLVHYASRGGYIEILNYIKTFSDFNPKLIGEIGCIEMNKDIIYYAIKNGSESYEIENDELIYYPNNGIRFTIIQEDEIIPEITVL